MKNTSPFIITKASGKKVEFSEEKLRDSIKRAGATEEQIEDIVADINGKLYTGIPTKKIYRLAFNKLKDHSSYLAAKYHLKKGIMELGPSGFPFEKFIGEILIRQGYSVKIGEVVKGQCVNHEIDLVAEKEDHLFMIECKYHNQSGTVCDVKIPLYIQARFKDVEIEWIKLPASGQKFHQGWVVTNTRFTDDAIQYGNCAGLKLLSWDYPAKESLKSQIDDLGLYPITCLTSLAKQEKQLLLSKNIVLSKDICNNDKILSEIGLNEARAKLVLEESSELCSKDTNVAKTPITKASSVQL